MNTWFSILCLDALQTLFTLQNVYIAHHVCLVDRISYTQINSPLCILNHVMNLFNVENVRKIYVFFQMKSDSVASFVHNNMFRSLVTTTGCVFLCWIQCYIWNFFTTIIKDLYTNKVNCVIHENKNTTELSFQ